MTGFDYPTRPHVRRHGPSGYEDYDSYRDWLRDEFTFRCVYCLHREQWDGRSTIFHIDHLVPVIEAPSQKCEYSNLVYACGTCNEAKRAILGIPDPCQIPFSNCLRILPDGRVAALNGHGEKLTQVLRLNSESNRQARSRWIRILETIRTTNLSLYQELMGFPDHLPDLRKKHAPYNTKPQGIADCYFALRERGELPVTY